jgi:hypothetical protein
MEEITESKEVKIRKKGKSKKGKNGEKKHIKSRKETKNKKSFAKIKEPL